MSKKVLVISTSLRRHSNSHALAEEFAKGAKEAGHQVELISLIGRQIEYCVGCLSCQRTGQCVIEDDANLIAEKMLKADVVCYATPIYYYEMAGQMKTLLDRVLCQGRAGWQSLCWRGYRPRGNSQPPSSCQSL